MATLANARNALAVMVVAGLVVVGPGWSQEPGPGPGEAVRGDEPKAGAGESKGEAVPGAEPGGRVVRTEGEWRRLLTPEQFFVMRMKGTEPPWSGRYARGHFKGTFVCAGCEAELFNAAHKFESGTGWPSFWRTIRDGVVTTAPDYSMAEPRIEVNCARCDAHLGHVFRDGPAPTGLRFCMNSVSLKLKPPGASAATQAKARPKAAAKAKSKARTGSRATPKPGAAGDGGDDSPSPE